MTANPALHRQYDSFVEALESADSAALRAKKQKLTILNDELQLVLREDWAAIAAKKSSQLELIEQRFKEFYTKGLLKPWKLNRRPPDTIHPTVARHHKSRERIKADLETLRRQQYAYYREALETRMRKCIAKIEALQDAERLLSFQLASLPLLQELGRPALPSEPWCLSAPNLPALPCSRPPYHLLDQQRVRLTLRSSLETTPATETERPAFLPFSRGKRKSAAATAVQLLKTNDEAAQLRHLGSLVPAGAAASPEWCPECYRMAEWSKEERDGFAVCKACGFSRDIAACCKESFYGMDIDYTEPFHYEKRNHFIDCLRQRQAKEEPNIPPLVFATVKAEIFRRQIYDPRQLRPKHMRNILKSVGLNNYYDHEILIWSIVTGSKPPQFTEKQEATLIRMFDQSLLPYRKYKGERNNYLTYSFAVHKMLEILDWPREIREFYPVLKSDSKRVAQEAIWHKVCADLDWPIIATEQQFIDEAKG